MLIQLINENGGMAIIPETHVNLILRSWQAHIRPIVDPVPMRTVSLVFRKDYIHEQRVRLYDNRVMKTKTNEEILADYLASKGKATEDIERILELHKTMSCG